MFAYIWPVALVIVSNTVYHICAKSVPENVSPFASLTLTYLVAAVCSFIMFRVGGSETGFVREISRMNWAPYVLGVVIIGLEVGTIYAYKAGWQVSVESLVQSAFLAVALVFVGFFLYKEALTWNKIAGVIICLAGLAVINMK